MILNNYTNEVETTEELDQSIDFSIDQESLGVLFKGFSDTLYSNKIGSIVREIASNCFDSHQEANVDVPVTIQIVEPEYDGTGGKIVFTDYGMGLSPDRIKNIYSKYFSSTKRGDNGQIGGFGIGAKSPLSYTETFFVDTVFDKILYKYIIHRGTTVPKIELLHKEPIEKGNGTSVIIPLVNRGDEQLFRRELKAQLQFFDNIDYVNCDISNDYRIFQGEHFIVRVGEEDKQVKKSNNDYASICLGKVKYPIDFSVCGMYSSDWYTKIAIKMEIGDLPVTMNREMIEYTPKAIEKIKNKIAAAQEEIQELVKTANQTDDFKQFLELGSSKPSLRLEEYQITTGNFAKDVTYKFTPLDDRITIPKDPFFEFPIETRLYQGNVLKLGITSGKRRQVATKKSVREFLYGSEKVLRIKEKASKRKNMYIEETIGSVYLMRHNEVENMQIASLLGIMTQPDRMVLIEQYRALILDEVLKNSQSYDRTVIDPAWTAVYEENLKANRVTYVNENVTLRIARYEHPTIDFMMYDGSVRSLLGNFKACGTVVYGFQGEEKKLEYAMKVFMSFRTFDSGFTQRSRMTEGKIGLIVKIARDNVKYFKHLDNFIHIDDFQTKRAKIIAKVHFAATAYSMYRQIQKLNSVTFSIDHPWHAKTKVILDFLDKYNMGFRPITQSDDSIAVMYKHNNVLYDMKGLIEELKTIIETYPLLVNLEDLTSNNKPNVYKYLNAEKKSPINYLRHE